MSRDINIEKATASELHAQKAPYTSISNSTVDLLTNPDALAIWTYLQTRAPGWKVIGEHLQKHFDMGRVRYRAAMRYLAEKGLITHKAVRDEAAGRMAGTRIIVHYQPKVQEPVTSVEPSVQDSARSESASLTETTPYVIKDLNTELSNGEVTNTDVASVDAPADRPKARNDYPADFEEAWKAYPAREGSNDKRKAFSCWKARLSEGVDPAAMLAGVQRYSEYCKAKGNIGTEYVMQGQRFFGKGREFENQWAVAPGSTAPHRTSRPTPRHTGLAATAEGFTSQDGGMTFDL